MLNANDARKMLQITAGALLVALGSAHAQLPLTAPYAMDDHGAGCQSEPQTSAGYLSTTRCRAESTAERSNGRITLDLEVDSGMNGTAPGTAATAWGSGWVKAMHELEQIAESVRYEVTLHVDSLVTVEQATTGTASADTWVILIACRTEDWGYCSWPYRAVGVPLSAVSGDEQTVTVELGPDDWPIQPGAIQIWVGVSGGAELSDGASAVRGLAYVGADVRARQIVPVVTPHSGS